MVKIYISSPYEDLKEYREAVYHALRQMKHDVIAMEYYVATDQRPLQKCLEDVASCDIYIGIFAWRYGFIPQDKKDNPDGLSITELEYRKAKELGIPCLVFLLDDKAAWILSFVDGTPLSGTNGENINRLRNELKNDQITPFFKNPDDLSVLVVTSVGHELQKSNNLIPRNTSKSGILNTLSSPHEQNFDLVKDDLSDIVFEYKSEVRSGALFIDMDQFIESPLPVLKMTGTQSSDICSLLKSNGRSNFDIPDEFYLTGKDATFKKIQIALSKIFRQDNSYNLVLFYFKGYWFFHSEEEIYLSSSDVDTMDPFISGLSIKSLKEVISLPINQKKKIIMIMDCCCYADDTHQIDNVDLMFKSCLRTLSDTDKIIIGSIEKNYELKEKTPGLIIVIKMIFVAVMLLHRYSKLYVQMEMILVLSIYLKFVRKLRRV